MVCVYVLPSSFTFLTDHLPAKSSASPAKSPGAQSRLRMQLKQRIDRFMQYAGGFWWAAVFSSVGEKARGLSTGDTASRPALLVGVGGSRFLWAAWWLLVHLELRPNSSQTDYTLALRRSDGRSFQSASLAL